MGTVAAQTNIEKGTAFHMETERLLDIVSFVNRHNGCSRGIEVMEGENDSLEFFCAECNQRGDENCDSTIEYIMRIDVIPEFARILADRLDKSNRLRAGGS